MSVVAIKRSAVSGIHCASGRGKERALLPAPCVRKSQPVNDLFIAATFNSVRDT